MLSKNHKIHRPNSVKQAAADQEIEDRVARREMIQQSVKAGTYYDSSQPWNKYHRWVEDGEPQQ